MQFGKIFALAAFFASVAVAVPTGDSKPKPKPNKPNKPQQPPKDTTVQTNNCGNGAAPYCCTADGKGAYSSCYAYGLASQCSQTTVCCNADDGAIQICIGSAQIVDNPFF